MNFFERIKKIKNNHVKKAAFGFLKMLLLSFIPVSFLFGSTMIFTKNDDDILNYMTSVIYEGNNKSGNEVYWSVTPNLNYDNFWYHYRLNETLYGFSNLYTTKGYSDHNFTFMINMEKNEEVSICVGEEKIYVTVLTSPSSGGFKSFGFRFSQSIKPDYRESFYISESLSQKISELGNEFFIDVNGLKTEIEFSGTIKSVSNPSIKDLVGENFIVIPSRKALDIKNFSGHCSFIARFRQDYFENYTYLRIIKHVFEGIEKGSSYTASFHDDIETAKEPFEDSFSDIQNKYNSYLATPQKSEGLLVPGILLSVVGCFVYVICIIFFLKNKKHGVIIIISTCLFSMLPFVGICNYLYKSGFTKFFPWSFYSICLALVFDILLISIFALFYLLINGNKKKNLKVATIESNNKSDYFEIEI